MRRKIFTMIALCILVASGIAGTTIQGAAKQKRNLKVLPETISDEALDVIMEEFNRSLGVDCKFCHSKGPFPDKLDYASDSKPEKEITRNMMLMTIEMNRKYFGAEKAMIGDSLLAVNCMMCHRGDPHPSSKK